MILLTGFEPFGGLAQNPSAAVAQAVGGGPVEAAVLPVDYEAVGPCLQDLLARPWDAVVLLGVAVGRSALSLERGGYHLPPQVSSRERLRSARRP